MAVDSANPMQEFGTSSLCTEYPESSDSPRLSSEGRSKLIIRELLRSCKMIT